MFNLTLTSGTIPSDWKIAEVRPIYKKGDKSAPGNYRPVSLTCIICKLMETFIKEALTDHLIDNDLLSNDQFGFVAGRSTVTQLLVTVEEWMNNLDNNLPTDAIYMDFAKAFDSVPHKRLLKKLEGYGIGGDVLNWINSFLSDRTQFVKINNSQSTCLDVTSGVPQGSVLGPTLFIYFINDLPDTTTVTTKIFADDTKAFSAIKNDEDQKILQEGINSMYNWTEKWLLKFNKQKCKIIHIGKNNRKLDYTIGTDDNKLIVEKTELEKGLGVKIDPQLNFKNHVKLTVKKPVMLHIKL